MFHTKLGISYSSAYHDFHGFDLPLFLRLQLLMFPDIKYGQLMAYSLFDHRHFSTILQHDRIAALFSEEAEIDAMLRFEGILAAVEADLDIIPKAAGKVIETTAATLRPQSERLMIGIQRDALVVPILVQILREAVGTEHGRHVHFGATSQDVLDTGLILRLREALTILRNDLAMVISTLEDFKAKLGKVEIMGRTRMQRALPITFGDRIDTWTEPLFHHQDTLMSLGSRLLTVQFGGAVGTLDKLGDDGPNVRAALAKRLKLADPGRAWHAQRDRIADLAHWLSQVSGGIGKIGQDLMLMTQNEIGEITLASTGTSSTMPHKRNPVQAELLVTLARLNAGKIATMGQSIIHEGERSGVAWTLEWFVLPEMVATTAASLMIAKTVLEGLEMGSPHVAL